MLTSLALLASAIAQDPAAVPSTRLVLEALDGTVQIRGLEGLSLTDPRAEGAVFARYEGLDVPQGAGPRVDRAVVDLHGGDRILGWVQGGDDEHLDLAPAQGSLLRLTIEEVAALVVPGRLPTDGSSNPTAPEEGDCLYVQRGRGVDQIDGVLLQFEAGGVRFEGRLGERLYPWDEVAALFVEDLGSEAPPVPKVPVLVEVVGGGRLSGGLVLMDDSGVTLSRAVGTLFLPAGLVHEVAMNDGSYRFLSDFEVADRGPVTLFGGDDDLGMVYPHRVDRNCLDGPLVSGGRGWSRGLGVHAPSRLTWRLGGAWTRLRAMAAIDDSALSNRHPGSVIFRVIADGKEIWTSPMVRGGDPLQHMDVSLEGVDELVLEVDAATEGFVSDRGNWLRPILLGR